MKTTNLFHWYIENQKDKNGKMYPVGVGFIVKSAKMDDAKYVRTSAIKEIELKEDTKEVILKTMNTIYRCQIEACNFEKKSTFDFVKGLEKWKDKVEKHIAGDKKLDKDEDKISKAKGKAGTKSSGKTGTKKAGAKTKEKTASKKAGDKTDNKLLFLCYERCSTCKKAEKWLIDNGISYEKRSITDQRPKITELRKWKKLSGQNAKKFFNTSGKLYREMGLKDKTKEMTEDQMLKEISKDGMLCKRPLLVAEDDVLIGFKEDKWSEKLL